MIKVYTTGVFDLLHRGHINILTQAKALGDKLVVGLATDDLIEAVKGERPTLDFFERKELLDSLPFVDEVLGYDALDQLPYYEIIKPNIIVQGDDWLATADRTMELNYFKTNDVRLILLPRTEGISSSDIKMRVKNGSRKDEQLLLNSIKLLPVTYFKLYEEYNETRVQRLVEKIKQDRAFTNPISITQHGIVFDGVNRLEAAKRLGCNYLPAVQYDYSKVDLTANVHFKNGEKITRLSEFCPEVGERIEFPRRTKQEIIDLTIGGKMIPSGETWHRPPFNVINLPIPLDWLTATEPFDIADWLKQEMDIGNIRFYQQGVYTCNEY